jgi:hypothetical protein
VFCCHSFYLGDRLAVAQRENRSLTVAVFYASVARIISSFLSKLWTMAIKKP